MSNWKLQIGDAISGYLIDGVLETPYVGATLRVSQIQGLFVEITFPYVSEDDQLLHVKNWFTSGKPPRSLQLKTIHGVMTLCGIHNNGFLLRDDVAKGILKVEEIILDEFDDDEFPDKMRFQSLRSHIDGLKSFSELTAITQERRHCRETDSPELIVTVKARDVFQWSQGEATMVVRSGWRSSTSLNDSRAQLIIDDTVWLESSFDRPATFIEHFEEQWKVAILLSFLYGKPILFRAHEVKDESITDRSLAGDIVGLPWTPVYNMRTLTDFERETGARGSLTRLDANLDKIGKDGLEKWASNFTKWERFILPSYNVIDNEISFAENVVSATAMSIEAASNLIGQVEGEEETYPGQRPTFATHVFRSLGALKVNWPEQTGSEITLSRKSADVYNTVKHADRGRFPAREETIVVARIGLWIVRLLVVWLIDREELLEPFRGSDAFSDLKSLMERLNVRFG